MTRKQAIKYAWDKADAYGMDLAECECKAMVEDLLVRFPGDELPDDFLCPIAKGVL